MELIFPYIIGIFSLLFSLYLILNILKAEKGTKKMKQISDYIRKGSDAYLKRQYKTLIPIITILAIVFYFVFGSFASMAFLLGASCSCLAGYIGMNISVRANVRTANAARKILKDALRIAIDGGMVMGLCVVSLGLLGITTLYFISKDPAQIIGFSFGASLIALFSRVGGGIYTKAADVGADLVGKVEKGIPEDDPRNPAVIADQVGDNVGDCAGMGADLFESYVATIISAMIIGLFFHGASGAIFPLLIVGFGIFASIVGSFFVKATEKESLRKALNKGIFANFIISAIGIYFISKIFGSIGIFLAALAGLIVVIFIGLFTEYYTSTENFPVKSIANASQAGVAMNVLTGFSFGLMSTLVPVIAISLAIFLAYKFADIYGIVIAATAMHSTTGLIVGLDAYGPISDNASGIVEMCKLGKKTRKITDKLDALGNTTKALCKGFAISDAVLAAIALFIAYIGTLGLQAINITKPNVFLSLLIGGLLPFICCSFCIRAVSNAAFKMVGEIRRQFKEIPGIMEGKNIPDYERCIDISTKSALKGMLGPASIAVFVPILIGFIFGPEAVGGLIVGCMSIGLLLAITLAICGAAWDNAKKYIEDGNLGGKGSDTHKAAVIGDTIGDPFKDTAAPSLNILIKVVNTISLLFAAIFLQYALLGA